MSRLTLPSVLVEVEPDSDLVVQSALEIYLLCGGHTNEAGKDAALEKLNSDCVYRRIFVGILYVMSVFAATLPSDSLILLVFL